MVCFQTKKSNLGKFWRALEWKSLVHSLVILNILRPFGTFCGHLVILWHIDTFYPDLVHCVEKNLATLHTERFQIKRGMISYVYACIHNKSLYALEAWLSGTASASGTEDHLFKSRQGVTLLRLLTHCTLTFETWLVCLSKMNEKNS
jgi:hypothetical protein